MRHQDPVPLPPPQLQTWPETQACPLSGESNWPAESTEPHQSGPQHFFIKVSLKHIIVINFGGKK